jgi:hypothetical protein
MRRPLVRPDPIASMNLFAKPRRRSLIVALFLSTLMAALVGPATAMAGEPKNSATFDYSCTLTLSVCRQAGIEAGSSPAAVTRYLDTVARQKRPPTGIEATAASFVPGYGYTTNDGGNGRYYGWQLKKGVYITLNYFRCQVVNGVLVNCVKQGEIGVQAKFILNGHAVQGITTTVTNITPLNLEVSHNMVCLPGGDGCIPPTGSEYRPMAPSGADSYRFAPLYLPGPGAFQLAFAWIVFDPPIASTATTPIYASLIFNCEPLGPPDDPGECYYIGYQEGLTE